MEGHGNVTLVESLEEFNLLIQTAEDKLVVVDFFASWCAPCRAIAPHFQQLSRDYHPQVIFLKVDVDRNPDISAQCGITAMPTFSFYKNGTLIHEFKGANGTELEASIRMYANALPSTQTASVSEESPYKHFPQKAFLAFAGEGKMDALVKKTIEFNDQLKKDSTSNAITDTELSRFKALIAIIEDDRRYHTTRFEPSDLKLLIRLAATWPVQMNFPVLDVLRRIVLVPSAADYYGKECNSDLISVMLKLSENTGILGNSLMCMRFFANLFRCQSLRDVITRPGVSSTLLNSVKKLAHHQNKQIRLAAATILLNYAIAEGRQSRFHPQTRIVKRCQGVFVN